MKTISGKAMCVLIKRKGWTLARVEGSHHIFTKTGSNLRITVPVHGNRDLKSGLQRSIMKHSGISENEL